MKKIEIINVKTPDIPKNHDDLLMDSNDFYSEKENIKNTINDIFDEGTKIIKIDADYRKAEAKLSEVLYKYYFLKLFSKSANKENDFNKKMLSIDKYINQIKKYFLDIKKMKNSYSKKNILTENEVKELYYKVFDFLGIEKSIEDDLKKFENENYPRFKMLSYNMCKDKSYQELEKLSLEVNSFINGYKNLTDAYDYVCYNSGNLIFEMIDSLVKAIKEEPKKSKLRVENRYFFDNDVIMYLDYLGWVELFSKIQYVKERTDPSIFKKDDVKEKYYLLEKNYLVVLIYNEFISRKDEQQ